jgi:hypothetical protein
VSSSTPARVLTGPVSLDGIQGRGHSIASQADTHEVDGIRGQGHSIASQADTHEADGIQGRGHSIASRADTHEVDGIQGQGYSIASLADTKVAPKHDRRVRHRQHQRAWKRLRSSSPSNYLADNVNRRRTTS